MFGNGVSIANILSHIVKHENGQSHVTVPNQISNNGDNNDKGWNVITCTDVANGNEHDEVTCPIGNCNVKEYPEGTRRFCQCTRPSQPIELQS